MMQAIRTKLRPYKPRFTRFVDGGAKSYPVIDYESDVAWAPTSGLGLLLCFVVSRGTYNPGVGVTAGKEYGESFAEYTCSPNWASAGVFHGSYNHFALGHNGGFIYQIRIHAFYKLYSDDNSFSIFQSLDPPVEEEIAVGFYQIDGANELYVAFPSASRYEDYMDTYKHLDLPYDHWVRRLMLPVIYGGEFEEAYNYFGLTLFESEWFRVRYNPSHGRNFSPSAFDLFASELQLDGVYLTTGPVEDAPLEVQEGLDAQKDTYDKVSFAVYYRYNFEE